MHSLLIHRGYYRASNTSGDVRMCPDHSTLNISLLSQMSKPSGCDGGVGGGDALCRDGLGGIYCQECSPDLAGSHYYHTAERECLECVQSMPRGAWLLVALFFCSLLALLIGRFAKGRLEWAFDQLLALSRRISSSSIFASLVVTTKTLIGFFQVVSEVEEVFIMELPLKSVRIIKAFSWLHLNISDLIQLECIGLGGYIDELRFTASAPALIVMLLSLGALIREAAVERKRGWKLARGTVLMALPWVLLVTFLVSPDISSLAFRSFRCECFGEEMTDERMSWLRADYSVLCTTNGCPGDPLAQWTPEWVEARRSGWAVLCVYALGVPCVYALLLFSERRTIMDEDHTPLADALAFLHEDYKPSCYGWDLAVFVHKLTTVGFSSLIMPGTMSQLVVAMLIMLTFQLLIILKRPYRSPEAGLLALVEQTFLLIFMVLCFIVKAEQLALQLPEDQMTEEVHRAFFYDTELIANSMVASLAVAVAVAAFMSLHQATPAVLETWKEARAFGIAESTARGPSTSKYTAATRASALADLRRVLDQQSSTLQVPEILHAEDATTNPVLLVHMAADKEKARQLRMKNAASALRSGGGGSTSSAHRHHGALRLLKLNLDKNVEEEQTAASQARVLHMHLRRQHGVQGLVSEDMAPERVAELRQRVRSASRKVPLTDAHGRLQRRQLAAFRMRLESRGWRGAEKIMPKTRWQLGKQMIVQGRLTGATDGDEMDQVSQQESMPMPQPMPRVGSVPNMVPPEQGSHGVGGNCGCSSGRTRPRRPAHQRSLEHKLEGSVRDLSQIGIKLNEEEAAAAERELSRRKRRASLTAGDDQWENMVVKDRPRRETLKGIERDHTPLASVIGRGGNLSERSMRESSVAERSRRNCRESSRRTERSPGSAASSNDVIVTFAVGERVQHDTRGGGTVVELLEDGRTRVEFDNGGEHRYHPRSMNKLRSLGKADDTDAKAASASSGGPGKLATVLQMPSTRSSSISEENEDGGGDDGAGVAPLKDMDTFSSGGVP